MAVLFLALGFGVMDLMLPTAWAICLDVAQKYAGAVTGAMNMSGQLGGFLCTVLFGYAVERSGSYHTPLFVIAFMLLVSASLFSRIDPTIPLVPEETCEGPFGRVCPPSLRGETHRILVRLTSQARRTHPTRTVAFEITRGRPAAG